MREELIRKLREIVEGEKLAMDSYFFCGSGSSVPDSELISSGEALLKALDEGKTDEAAKAKLIERLNIAAVQKKEVLKSRVRILDDAAEDPKVKVVKEILESIELL
ncbi:MAG: hypothetical protein Q4E57_01990 [Eubacteriales bacterium]|nr:hypothetical protein [Eubacteriales bacterium]